MSYERSLPCREVDVEFGEVEAGVVAVKMMEIINRSCVSV